MTISLSSNSLGKMRIEIADTFKMRQKRPK